MSIAVTALIHPSRCLSMMVGIMFSLILLIAALIGVGAVGDLLLITRLLLALMIIVMAALLYRHWYRRRASFKLSISGTGQIRLQRLNAGRSEQNLQESESMTLLPASTLWPHLLILHLQDTQGSIEVVLIMRDSVSQETFNALLVATRWLSNRQPETEPPAMRQN